MKITIVSLVLLVIFVIINGILGLVSMSLVWGLRPTSQWLFWLFTAVGAVFGYLIPAITTLVLSRFQGD